MRRLLAILGLVSLLLGGGCDFAGPDEGERVPAAPETGLLRGSVHLNDGSDAPGQGPAREPNELGIEGVRVDVVSPDGGPPYASVLTNSAGLFEVRLPLGPWIVQVTPDSSAGAFNPVLFHAYTPTFSGQRSVLLRSEVTATAEFGFDPDLATILDDLTDGPYQTEGSPPADWLRWILAAQAGQTCPDQGLPVCRSEIERYLDAIIFGPDPGDNFFGNPDPYVLSSAVDPLAEAVRILSAVPATEAEDLVRELFVAELNFHAGFGSPNPAYDRTLLYYLEMFVGPQSTSTTRRKTQALVLAQLDVARAYNRGGGGGGEIGD